MANKYQRIVIDQDICISCGACIAVCPYQAIEFDNKNKAILIWDKCKDSFDCIPVCPVNCIWKSSEAPGESRDKDEWFKFSKELSDDEKKDFEEWKSKFKIGGKPAK